MAPGRDTFTSLFVQLPILGFQDAQGNAIPATVTPGLAQLAALRRARP